MKRIILCLDGTWNSTYAKEKREDGTKVIKPSNVLKLARSVLSKGQGKGINKIPQIVYYDSGVGSLSKFPGRANKLLSFFDEYLGGVWGAGFESNIEEAMTFLINNYNPKDQVYLFGFSRGAATARAITHFIDWMGGSLRKEDVFYLPVLFREYISSEGKSDVNVIKQKIKDRVIKINESRTRHKIIIPFQKWQKININFLGVWDTVLSLGSRFFPYKAPTFYLKTTTANCVLHARQALAIDERRFDFLPSIWEGSSSNTKSIKQKWFAGVHSNIGGGYNHDGLANITFHWMKNELIQIYPDFAFNKLPFSIYKKFIQDELTDSFTLKFKLKDYITNKFGVRRIETSIDDDCDKINLSIDFTALQRMKSDPNKKTKGKLNYPNLDIYRPLTLLSYIKQKGINTILEPFKADPDINDIEINKVEEFLNHVFSPKQILTKSWKQYSGYKVKKNAKYKINLIETQLIYDWTKKSDFAGWLSFQNGKNKWFHAVSRMLSRKRSANIFSVIGIVDGKKIDLGKLWKEAGKKAFEIDFKNYFENESGEEKLYLFVNDVPGFYWNNKGSYTIEVEEKG
jgi:uncharacterized protein (DUF2235 family)